jgi:hypothetical protein
VDTDATLDAAGEGSRPGPLHAPTDGRQRRALDAAAGVAAEAGLDVSDAGIWRAGSAVLVGLPAVPALARVDEAARAGDARRQVTVAGLLARVGVPAVGVVGPADQPVGSAAGPVTIWAWEPPTGPAVGPREMGRAARVLHDRTRTLGHGRSEVPAGVPRHDPLPAVAVELDRAEAVGATATTDLRLLRRAVAHVGARWPSAADDPLGAAVVHGDLHRGNVVPGRSGPVLADLELAGWGGASVDVAPQVVAVRRYGAAPGDLEEFLDGYGVDPRGWDGLEALVEAYELWVTAWAVANRTASPRAEQEAEARLRRWRTGESPIWSLR